MTLAFGILAPALTSAKVGAQRWSNSDSKSGGGRKRGKRRRRRGGRRRRGSRS